MEETEYVLNTSFTWEDIKTVLENQNIEPTEENIAWFIENNAREISSLQDWIISQTFEALENMEMPK